MNKIYLSVFCENDLFLLDCIKYIKIPIVKKFTQDIQLLNILPAVANGKNITSKDDAKIYSV